MSSRYRRVSPTERLYLALGRPDVPWSLQLNIDGEGALPLERWRGAMALAAAANPGVRLVRRGGWWCDGLPPAVRECVFTQNDDLDTPVSGLHPDRGPMAEVIVGAGGRLAFRALHAEMDARGLLHWAAEVFRALRGDPLLGTNTARNDYEILQSRRGAWGMPPMRNDCAPLLSGTTSAPGEGFVRARRTLRRGAGPFVARLAAALTRAAPAGRFRFMIPVDLRPPGGEWRTTANMSNPLFLDVSPAADWPAIHGAILGQLAEGRQWTRNVLDPFLAAVPVSVSRLLADLSQRRQLRGRRFQVSAILSHVGKVELGDLSCPGFAARSAWLLPVNAPGTSAMFVSLEHDFGIELLASMPASLGGGGRLDDYMDRLKKELDISPCEITGTNSLASRERERPEMISATAPSSGRSRSRLASDRASPGLHELFERQAQACPERVAATFRGDGLTYGELDRRANALARRLIAEGVRPGTLVASCLRRSFEALVALLGVLKADAAFVPLDPAWPLQRIRFVLDDCAAPLVITAADQANVDFGRKVIRVDNVADGSRAKGVGGEASAAYVLYTSGSTGRPKGVVVGHASIVNYVTWAAGAYLDGLVEPVFPLFTALTFDLTLTSIFVPLICGGRIVIHDGADAAAVLHDILTRGEANVVKLTPSHLKIVRELDPSGSVVKRFVVGGEDLLTPLARDIHLRCGGRVEIFNEYGPTEATIGCMIHRYDPETDVGPSVPIGRPIPGAEAYLLDNDLRPVAEGDCGEIVLAGACLARGYLNRPDDATFLPHPFQAGKVCYRTGDLAVWQPSTGFSYRGRADEQVKVSGHRVEIGEVEAALREVDGVRDSAVVAAPGSGGAVRLTAFVVSARRDEAALRFALRAKLPAYMEPAEFRWADALPLTPHGKIDKTKLLPPMPAQGIEAEMEPRQGIATELAQMARKAAGGADVPLGASLYDCGFDSLTIALLLARVTSRWLNPEEGGRFFARAGELARRPSLEGILELLRSIHGPAVMGTG